MTSWALEENCAQMDPKPAKGEEGKIASQGENPFSPPKNSSFVISPVVVVLCRSFTVSLCGQQKGVNYRMESLPGDFLG